MLIGICDDDRDWCESAEKIVMDYAQTKHIKEEVICFYGREELLTSQGAEPDVLFLDICFENDADGIKIAEWVNQNWKKCQIVYLTDYLFYATEVYHTAHVFYVLKEQFADRIEEVFEKIFHEIAQQEKQLIFSLGGGKELCLYPKEILYFERVKRTTMIVTEKGTYQIKSTLDEIMQHLPKLDFVRCHNSYIVYFPAVHKTQKNCLILKDGTEVMISRSYERKVKEAFIEWAMTQIT